MNKKHKLGFRFNLEDEDDNVLNTYCKGKRKLKKDLTTICIFVWILEIKVKKIMKVQEKNSENSRRQNKNLMA